MMHFVVNKEQWNKLPKNYQRIWRQACDASNNWMLGRYDILNGAGAKAHDQPGNTIARFPDTRHGSLL